MSFDYEEEEDYDPVEQEKGWVLDFFLHSLFKILKRPQKLETIFHLI